MYPSRAVILSNETQKTALFANVTPNWEIIP